MSHLFDTHSRPLVRGTGGMVSAAHPLAAGAGARVLEDGGTAYDAIVATAAVLNVAEPFMSGLAGLGVATVYDAKTQQVRVVDFHPPVPQKFDAATMTEADIFYGANASGTPGNLAGWCALRDAGGTMGLDRLLAPAIRYARDGVPKSQFFLDMVTLAESRPLLPDYLETYVKDPAGMALGAVHRQPALADTLDAIASEGPSYLYDGPLGRKMVAHLQALGGCMTLDDLAAVAPVWEEPISTSYRGLEVNVPAPPAESFQILVALALLETVDFRAMAHQGVDHLDIVFRAIRLASELRLANNKCTPDQAMALLDERKLAPLLDRLNDPQPITARTEKYGEGALPEGVQFAREHTTSMSAVDRFGNAICLTQSLGSMFGSGVVIPGTGVCMNNFLNWADLNPDSPNYLKAGERFGMCLAPSISLKDGAPVLSLGTPGSYGILQTQVQAMVHHLDYGLGLQDAIDAPRARLWDGRVVHVESRIDPATVKALKGRGHEVSMIAPMSMACGGMHAVKIDPVSGALEGAADSRRDGAAIPA